MMMTEVRAINPRGRIEIFVMVTIHEMYIKVEALPFGRGSAVSCRSTVVVLVQGRLFSSEPAYICPRGRG